MLPQTNERVIVSFWKYDLKAMLGGRKQASEMVFGHPKMRYAHMLKILFMVFLKYSPFSHCQLLLMCSDGEENSSDHLKDANQPNNISMGLWNFFFFLKMADSYVLGIYF